MSKREKSFTLIELLVVIAIIGILAGIVLGVLGGARDRAKDARIMTDMVQLRTQAELIFNRDGDYLAVDCLVDIDIITLCNDVEAQGGENSNFPGQIPAVNIVQSSPPDRYCAEIRLNSGKFWCVDSELKSAQYDTNPACHIVLGIYTCE